MHSEDIGFEDWLIEEAAELKTASTVEEKRMEYFDALGCLVGLREELFPDFDCFVHTYKMWTRKQLKRNRPERHQEYNRFAYALRDTVRKHITARRAEQFESRLANALKAVAR